MCFVKCCLEDFDAVPYNEMHALVAQWIEQRTSNPCAVGSTPTERATTWHDSRCTLVLFLNIIVENGHEILGNSISSQCRR